MIHEESTFQTYSRNAPTAVTSIFCCLSPDWFCPPAAPVSPCNPAPANTSARRFVAEPSSWMSTARSLPCSSGHWSIRNRMSETLCATSPSSLSRDAARVCVCLRANTVLFFRSGLSVQGSEARGKCQADVRGSLRSIGRTGVASTHAARVAVIDDMVLIGIAQGLKGTGLWQRSLQKVLMFWVGQSVIKIQSWL